jgi:hypothetical protein
MSFSYQVAAGVEQTFILVAILVQFSSERFLNVYLRRRYGAFPSQII